MRTPRTSRGWAVVAGGTALAVAAALAPATSATAEDEDDPTAPAGAPALLGEDTRELSPEVRDKALPVDRRGSADALRRARADALPARTAVGTQRTWAALDDSTGRVYFKRYQLRAKGPKVQVWVANDRAFPTDDCRTDLGLTEVTQAQVNRFVRAFDRIYAVESRVFSVPPRRNGRPSLAEDLGLPADYWQVGRGESDDIVVLVDNVRDANYYDPTSADGQTFIAGFHYSLFNEVHDRNIMTIDAYDWRHRTGGNPPDDRGDPAYEACAEELGGDPATFGRPRPNDYEGTFAHEYQHLLEYYEDPDEETWVNEGLADYAQTITGYSDTRVPVDREAADSHLACFGGFLGRSYGGAENSLTLWEDQGGPQILCDYGAAYSFMEYLHSRYGNALLGRLHRNNADGLAGLDRVLDATGAAASPMKLVRRWAAMVALDRQLDRNDRRITGMRAGPFTAKTLGSLVLWRNPESYDEPGAPPNGSDYVRLRDGAGTWLGAADVESIGFTGTTELDPDPLAWTTVATPPATVPDDAECGDTVPAGGGPAALHSGCGESLDRAAVRQVTVPQNGATLSFDALWDIEEGYDYAVVQVSTDQGESWTTLPASGTTSQAADTEARIVRELPGYTGSSAGWESHTADLSAYAGQQVHLAFRYLTDGGVDETGFWVRDIQVGGTTLGTDAADWRSATQVNPVDVDGWTVHLVSYGGPDDHVRYHRLPLRRAGGAFTGELSGAALDEVLGRRLPVVAAVVMQDDPDTNATKQAGYELLVNGSVVQPGGGGQP